MLNVLKAIDKASGYVFQSEAGNTLSSMMSVAVGADFDFFKYRFYYVKAMLVTILFVFRNASVKEKYLNLGDENQMQ